MLSAPHAQSEGWDYEHPAEMPEERVIRLEEAVTKLQKNRTFENVQIVCLNVRFAWGGMYFDGTSVKKIEPGIVDCWKPDTDTLLDRFISVADRAIMLISDTYTPIPEKADLIARYTRSCSKRLSWAKLLKQGREKTLVWGEMFQYVEALKFSPDSVD